MVWKKAWTAVWEATKMVSTEGKCIKSGTFDIEENIAELEEDNFKRLYRFKKEKSEILLALLQPEMERQRRFNTTYNPSFHQA